jgi:metal-responsive CopG/Arc/MetJ family transcriptional regulator
MTNSNTIGMKTALSIPDDLFEEVSKLAQENHSSRSRIICTAIEDYLNREKSRKLLESLNKAYAEEENADEKLLRRKSLEYYESSILTNNDNKTG